MNLEINQNRILKIDEQDDFPKRRRAKFKVGNPSRRSKNLVNQSEATLLANQVRSMTLLNQDQATY